MNQGGEKKRKKKHARQRTGSVRRLLIGFDMWALHSKMKVSLESVVEGQGLRNYIIGEVWHRSPERWLFSPLQDKTGE